MKKIKLILSIALLSVSLIASAGNTLAADTGGFVATGFLTSLVGEVVTFLRGDSCPVRQCGDCRPPNGTEEGGVGDCRPPQ